VNGSRARGCQGPEQEGRGLGGDLVVVFAGEHGLASRGHHADCQSGDQPPGLELAKQSAAAAVFEEHVEDLRERLEAGCERRRDLGLHDLVGGVEQGQLGARREVGRDLADEGIDGRADDRDEQAVTLAWMRAQVS